MVSRHLLAASRTICGSGGEQRTMRFHFSQHFFCFVQHIFLPLLSKWCFCFVFFFFSPLSSSCHWGSCNDFLTMSSSFIQVPQADFGGFYCHRGTVMEGGVGVMVTISSHLLSVWLRSDWIGQGDWPWKRIHSSPNPSLSLNLLYPLRVHNKLFTLPLYFLIFDSVMF